MHTVVAKRSQALDQTLPGQVEIFVDIFESGRSYRFNSNESALDVRGFHGAEKLNVFGGFHGDLSEENHIVGKLRQALHEFKTFAAERFEFVETGGVFLLL